MASVTCDRVTLCRGQTVTCACATGNSNSLAWMTNGSRLQFSSTDSLLTRRNVNGSSIFAVLTGHSNQNGVRVIMSNITVNVSLNSSDPEIVLTCTNIDHMISKPVILPVSSKYSAIVRKMGDI